jgi:hypothetical protein
MSSSLLMSKHTAMPSSQHVAGGSVVVVVVVVVAGHEAGAGHCLARNFACSLTTGVSQTEQYTSLPMVRTIDTAVGALPRMLIPVSFASTFNRDALLMSARRTGVPPSGASEFRNL